MRLLALLLLLTPAVTVAQGTGTLAGRVVDSSGVGLPGANVVIDGTTLGAATDADGNYRVLGVPVGTYRVTASSTGYHPVTHHDITINNGYTRSLDVAFVHDLVMGGTPTINCFHPLVSDSPYAPRYVSAGLLGVACGFPVSIEDLPVER